MLTVCNLVVESEEVEHCTVALSSRQKTTDQGLRQIPLVFHFQVAEVRKVQVAGGTLQGEANPTWTKQPMDKAVNAFGLVLVVVGLTRVTTGMYRLATGTGKIED